MEAKALIGTAKRIAGDNPEVTGISEGRKVEIDTVLGESRIAIEVAGIGRFLLDPEENNVRFRANTENGYGIIGDSIAATGIDLQQVLATFTFSITS